MPVNAYLGFLPSLAFFLASYFLTFPCLTSHLFPYFFFDLSLCYPFFLFPTLLCCLLLPLVLPLILTLTLCILPFLGYTTSPVCLNPVIPFEASFFAFTFPSFVLLLYPVLFLPIICHALTYCLLIICPAFSLCY